jgi:NarL family two-component system response regulator YdfI
VIRLLIAATSAIERAGLETLMASSPAIELAGSFPDLSSVDALRPDVVLTSLPVGEIPLPAGAGSPAYCVLANESWSADALRFGVRAIIARSASPAELLAAVEAAGAGFAVVDPRELEALLGQAVAAPMSGGESPLTTRELEVLRMLADGAANKTIAWKLGIAENTVKFHVASILGKLNASTRTEAVTLGIRRGLILL